MGEHGGKLQKTVSFGGRNGRKHQKSGQKIGNELVEGMPEPENRLFCRKKSPKWHQPSTFSLKNDKK